MIPVITISREFGSGGHSIGLKVSKALNIPFLDGEIIGKAAKKELEKKQSLKYSEIKKDGSEEFYNIPAASTMYFSSSQDDMFKLQKEIIIDAAKKGPCVIVGRCSDFILSNEDIKSLNILIHADINFRKDRILKRYGEIKNVGIEKRILKKDKQRSTYYKYYTDQTWGAYKNYDLSLDSGRIGEENCVKMICDLANIF